MKHGQDITVRQADTLKHLLERIHGETANGLFRHCIKVLKTNETSDEYPGNDERMFTVAAIAGIRPRDGIETMLAVQMAFGSVMRQ